MKHTLKVPVIAVMAGLFCIGACTEEFLEITPTGLLDEAVLATYEGVDALLIGAYSMLDGVAADGFGWDATTSGWVLGSIRGMEANKGTDSGDSSPINPIQNYVDYPTNPLLNIKWCACYEGISRCNAAIRTALTALDAGTLSTGEYDSMVRQARTLRGFYHFEAWRLWADRTSNTFVPYVHENSDPDDLTNLEDIRTLILEDLTSGTMLPLDMGQVGRFNRTVSQVLLAKALMQMTGDFATAGDLLEDALNGTNPAGQKAALEPRYGDIFDIEYRNGTESIYTVQYSVNDGSGGWNGGWGEVLNFPYKSGGSPGGCCGFFNPTQDFVNSFRTNANGLPFIDLAAGTYSYNEEMVTNDQGIAIDEPYTEYAGRLDPRLDWTVGRRGIPYWDWGIHTGQDWIRDQTYSGPYSPKKQVYKKSQEGTYTEVGNWTSGYTANGYRLIRYADVVLLHAECMAMTNDGDLGLADVNSIRNRATNPAGFVMEDDGSAPAANYAIGLYPSFASADEAMMAIRFERKLELGQEGHRYYDLQRWGEVESSLSRILAYEKTMPWGSALYGYASLGPEDVNFPIPQRQIDLSKGRLVQNR